MLVSRKLQAGQSSGYMIRVHANCKYCSQCVCAPSFLLLYYLHIIVHLLFYQCYIHEGVQIIYRQSKYINALLEY